MASRSEQIQQAAARLFAERGYGATSIDDIGAAAGVSGPAIYWHFPGKQALLAAMLTDVSEQLLAGGRDCRPHRTPKPRSRRWLVCRFASRSASPT